MTETYQEPDMQDEDFEPTGKPEPMSRLEKIAYRVAGPILLGGVVYAEYEGVHNWVSKAYTYVAPYVSHAVTSVMVHFK